MSDVSLYAFSGNQHLLAHRKLQQVKAEARDKGYRINTIDASIPGELRNAVSSDGLFFEDKMLVVAHHPESAPLDLLESQATRGDDGVVLVVFCEGKLDKRTKFGKFLSKLDHHLEFLAPDKSWEAEEQAHKFCIAEAKTHGKKLGERLPRAITDRVGFDLGRLSFEVEKMCLLADAWGEDEVIGKTVGAALAVIGEAEVQPVIRALEARDTPLLLRSLQRILETNKGSKSPVMKVSSYIENWAYRSLGVAEMREKEVDPEDAAIRLNLNPWFYKNKLLPGVRAWPLRDIVRLIEVVAQSQRSVIRGDLDSWTAFLVRLVRVCG